MVTKKGTTPKKHKYIVKNTKTHKETSIEADTFDKAMYEWILQQNDLLQQARKRPPSMAIHHISNDIKVCDIENKEDCETYIYVELGNIITYYWRNMSQIPPKGEWVESVTGERVEIFKGEVR